MFDFILLLPFLHLTRISRRVKSTAFYFVKITDQRRTSMFETIIKDLEQPSLYKETDGAFWNDEYISKQMLKTHLDPEFNGASRKLSFIESSVEWIKEVAPPANYPLLLDVGCGPGIYAEKFALAGFQVTGLDFSCRSIDYAKNSAKQKGLTINYIYQDYLAMSLNDMFDFATMIYCDYGALSTQNRKSILQSIYRRLKPGGMFLFDVFSIEKYNQFQEGETWKLHKNGGFWRDGAHIELSACYKYPDNITLEQVVIIDETGSLAYYLWNTCYSTQSLMKEVRDAGFKVCNIFSDVSGCPYEKNSSTIAILLEK